METALELKAPFHYNGKPISALGYRLYKIREQIDAAEQRGEVRLLDREDFERLVGDPSTCR